MLRSQLQLNFGENNGKNLIFLLNITARFSNLELELDIQFYCSLMHFYTIHI